jgi:hypothetical protein
MDRRLALTPLGKAPVLFAVGFGAVLPLAVAVVVILQVRSEALSPALMLLIQGLVALSVLAVVLPLWRREASFDGRRLKVKATYYTRESPLSDFDLAAARVVDTREHDALRPWLKTNGFALPGFQAGHFRLRDRRKAFCLVSDPSKVLALPHVDGRVWLLSLEHPQPVLDILRRAAG